MGGGEKKYDENWAQTLSLNWAPAPDRPMGAFCTLHCFPAFEQRGHRELQGVAGEFRERQYTSLNYRNREVQRYTITRNLSFDLFCET